MGSRISIWIDSADQLNVLVGDVLLHSFPGWGHALCYGFLIGAGMLFAAAILGSVRHLTRRTG